MNEPLATYAFLPWLRLGAGAEITRLDGDAAAEARPTIPISIRFNSDDAKTGKVQLELFGPGEVRSFDARAVIRTWPRLGVMDAEPNYLPLVEFDQPDLPWRYTPARATAIGRLTPWLALLTLADEEVDSITPPRAADLGRVSIKDAAVLPKHSQLWAWAHVQVTGEASVDEAKVFALLSSEPQRVISRILCPRRMTAKRSYSAFLVPTFRRGVLAGLGQDPPESVDGLAPAWTDATSGPLVLPVYYQWRFGTSDAGDFEALARLIKKFVTPPNIGVRDMDVSAPSPGAPPANNGPLGMLGMLRGLGTPETLWSGQTRLGWIAWLKVLLNRPVDRLRTPGQPRTVTPPLYGQWHAATDRCAADDPNAIPPWFQNLSVDPRLRVAAALGTQVVQANQEALMASAWEQVERIRQLNEELRQAQLAREVAERIMLRHIMVPQDETVLSLTAPVFARVKASKETIRVVLAESPVPRGLFEGAFRRVSRPLGPIGRRQGRAAPPPRPGLIARLNRGELSAAPAPPAPNAMSTPSRAGLRLAPHTVTSAVVRARLRRDRIERIIAIFLAAMALLLIPAGVPIAAALLGGLAVVGFTLSTAGMRAAKNLARRVALRDGTFTGDDVRAAVPPAWFTPREAPTEGAPRTLPRADNMGIPEASRAVVQAVRESLASVFDRVGAPVAPGPSLRPVDPAALRTKLQKALDPRRTIPAAYKHRYALPQVQWQPVDPIEPVMAAPDFPQPMYAELAKISVEWLLPGFSQIPRNVATLLLSSGKMVETYMVGLNHEMARELLWREYPTDQRGTYFRQFWDVAGFVPQPGETVDPESLKDITRIHTWPKGSELGSHSPRLSPPQGGDYIVLLVRGDLLRRYPNTIVYAARARWIDGGLREIQDPASDATDAEVAAIQQWPLFSGRLDPDGTFFGFRLTAAQVKGSATPPGDPGWYFVLQEHSSEPRFGLDEADPGQVGVPVAGVDWNNLSWGSLAAEATAFDALKTIDLDAELPDTTLVTDPVTRRWHATKGRGQVGSLSSDLAYITFQRPMRVGIHGADMIP
jgi:hypothetical protein